MPSSRNAALLDRTRNPQQRANVSSTRHERLDTFTPHLKGLLLMLGASLCWSTGGLFVRSVSIPNSWEIAFWRSLSMGVFLLVWLSFRYAGNVRRAVVAIGPGGFLAGLCMAASFLGFILAVTQTTVAHTLVIISTTPFLAALFGRVFLGELVPDASLRCDEYCLDRHRRHVSRFFHCRNADREHNSRRLCGCLCRLCDFTCVTVRHGPI